MNTKIVVTGICTVLKRDGALYVLTPIWRSGMMSTNIPNQQIEYHDTFVVVDTRDLIDGGPDDLEPIGNTYWAYWTIQREHLHFEPSGSGAVTIDGLRNTANMKEICPSARVDSRCFDNKPVETLDGRLKILNNSSVSESGIGHPFHFKRCTSGSQQYKDLTDELYVVTAVADEDVKLISTKFDNGSQRELKFKPMKPETIYFCSARPDDLWNVVGRYTPHEHGPAILHFELHYELVHPDDRPDVRPVPMRNQGFLMNLLQLILPGLAIRVLEKVLDIVILTKPDGCPPLIGSG